MNPDYKEIDSIQKNFFALLEELFKGITGKNYKNFGHVENFDVEIKKVPSTSKGRDLINTGYPRLYQELVGFYSQHAHHWFRLAKNLGGLNFVFGGGSRFTETHLGSTRKILLYSDTLFIPDPVFPWIEKNRTEEKFQHVLILKNIFILLQLKPLIDAKLAYPPIVVFPSFEKTLDDHDEETKERQDSLLATFFSHYLKETFNSGQEVADFALREENRFLNVCATEKLFWGVGADSANNIEEGLKEYREFIRKFRTGEMLETQERVSDSQLVFIGIMERLTPHLHLWENCLELNGNPLFCLDAHWHYHDLIRRAINDHKELTPETLASARALNNPRFSWLGNLTIEEMRLRKSNENEDFRSKLNQYVSNLDEADSQDLNKVANEISHGISVLLAEHEKEISNIQEKYNTKYKKILMSVAITSPALFAPIFQPFTGAIPPVAFLLQYAGEKISQVVELKKKNRSLIGVLAKAAHGA